MPAGVYNFNVEQGVGMHFTVEYRDGSGAPKDLTDWFARGQIKSRMSDCDPIAEFVIEFTDRAEGKLKVGLPPDALTDVKIKGNRYDSFLEAVYDIELYKADDDEVIRLLNGTVKISPEVTK